MNEYVDIVVEQEPNIVEVVTQEKPAYIEVVNDATEAYIDVIVEKGPEYVDVVVEKTDLYVDVIVENIVERVLEGGELIFGETPSGIIDGINPQFITEFDFVPEKIDVFLNGMVQKKIFGYNTSGTRIINFMESPLVNDIIQVNYLKQ